jgi:predicted  nucleic acid-binding Zn-ribbon protein
MAESLLVALATLQQIDLDRDRANHESAALTAALTDESAVTTTQARLDAAQRAARKAHLELQDAEAELAATESKIARNDQRLTSGAITTTQALAAVEHELAFLRESRSQQEERVLLAMDAVETTTADFATATTALETAKRDRAAEREQQAGQLVAAQRRFEILTAQRAEAVAQLDAASLARYEGIRKTRGRAVVPAIGGICQGCHVALLANITQKLRAVRDEIVTCPNCGRILVLG